MKAATGKCHRGSDNWVPAAGVTSGEPESSAGPLLLSTGVPDYTALTRRWCIVKSYRQILWFMISRIVEAGNTT